MEKICTILQKKKFFGVDVFISFNKCKAVVGNSQAP